MPKDLLTTSRAQPIPQTLNDTKLPEYLSKAQQAFITQKTPQQFIKKRPGPGNMPLSYVEIGYVINMLNQVFGYNWDFKVLDQQIGKLQVWVRGELAVRLRGQSIIKGQYGGADIKYNRNTKEPVSIADDLKAAASDCLKKCASMLGIAGDVYWRDLDSWDVETFDQSPQQNRPQAYTQEIRR